MALLLSPPAFASEQSLTDRSLAGERPCSFCNCRLGGSWAADAGGRRSCVLLFDVPLIDALLPARPLGGVVAAAPLLVPVPRLGGAGGAAWPAR
eukprot:14928133-Alexandrium_andersonii.AAC.1